MNYPIFLVGEIYLDLQDKMLLPFRASGLGFRFGLTPGAWVFHWACLLFGPGMWACAPIFQTLSVAPQPLCTVCVGKGCNVSRIGCDFHVLARGWIVRALSPSYVL